jgi:site-specific recombinase XerD
VQTWKTLNKAAEAVGIRERVGTHTLRKTFAYHAYKQGQDITLIQKLLNHSAPSVTLGYIGITQDQMDDVYLTLNI